MRIIIFGMCAVLAGGVFVAMFLSIWGGRGDPGRPPGAQQRIVTELVWALIPCLMIVAAAIPAAIAIIAGRG